MKISLSVLAPVCNSQSIIGPLASKLLDVLSELTERFELLMIDNGSTDATAEVIADLAILYPQMSRVVLPSRSDRATVMRVGLSQTSGEAALYRGESLSLGMEGVSDLWRALREGDIAVTRRPELASLGSIPALPREHAAEEPDWQIARRCVLDGWQRSRSNHDWASFLGARGYAIQEIDPGYSEVRPWSRSHANQKPPATLPSPRVQTAASHGSRPTRRPNYLDRIKSFALGE